MKWPSQRLTRLPAPDRRLLVPRGNRKASMAWVILAGVAIALIVLAFWAGTRRARSSLSEPRPRFDSFEISSPCRGRHRVRCRPGRLGDPKDRVRRPSGSSLGSPRSLQHRWQSSLSRAWSDRRRFASAIVAGLWRRLASRLGSARRWCPPARAHFEDLNNAPQPARHRCQRVDHDGHGRTILAGSRQSVPGSSSSNCRVTKTPCVIGVV